MIQSRLSQTTTAISRALERLSSGKRVSSPRDDAAAYSQAVKLESQVRGLSQEVRNNSAEMNELQNAESSLTSQLELIQRMREIAVQASSENLSANERENLTSELKGLLNQYLRASDENDDIKKKVGLGNFAPRLTTSSKAGVYEVKAADLNGDGRLDVVQRNSADGLSAHSLLGTGNGAFSPGTTVLMAGFSLDSIEIGDVNNDGILDLVGADQVLGYVSVALGNGDGTYQSMMTTYASATLEAQIELIDLDEDGNLDIAINEGGSLALLSGDGTGNFEETLAHFYLSTLGSAAEFKFGDFNGDGRADLVVLDWNGASTQIDLQIGLGQGNYTASATLLGPGLNSARTLLTTDLNHDGISDIIAAGDGQSDIFVAIGNSNGTLAAKPLIAIPGGFEPTDVTVGELNGDGNIDIAFITNIANSGTGIALGNGDGTFQTAKTLSNQRSNYHPLAIGDFDGDNVNDLTAGNFFYRALTKDVAAFSDVDISNTSQAENLIRILDSTIDSLNRKLGDIAAVHSRLDAESASKALLAETLEEARVDLTQADLALETSELLRLQILQQAQTAIYAQGNLSLSMVLKLLG